MAQKSHMIIPESEYTVTATRASGPGGQHVNKVSTAVILKFDILASSLPEEIKERLIRSGSRRISDEGILVIKSGSHRSQLQNKEAAVKRLHEIIRKYAKKEKPRVPTKPTKASVEKRLKLKSQRAEIKAHRRKPE